MPYETIEALPPEIRDEFSEECQQAFLEAFNSSQEADEADAFGDGMTAAQDCAVRAEEPAAEAGIEPDCGCDHAGEKGRKVLPLEETAVTDDGSGTFSGYANVFGIVDDGGDKVLKGAFKSVLQDFVKEGFIGWAHDWSKPVATIDDATEDDHGLLITATFHGTPEAQAARQITTERLKRGKSVGLSIGYEIGDAKDTTYGRDIKSFKRLFETSLVMVPMNRPSYVTAAKGTLGSGQPYAERLALALAQAEALTGEAKWLAAHSRKRADIRHKEGRILSGSNRERLKTLGGSLRDVLSDIEDLLSTTDPDRDKAAAQAAIARSILTLSGVYPSKGN